MAGSLSVGIAGAGIGGLATAAFVARSGHRVEVFDQFDAPAPVGSGLVVQPVGRAVLAELGALAEAQAQGQLLTKIQGTSVQTSGIVLAADYGTDPAHQGLGLHRASLFSVLLDACLAHGATLTPASTVTGRDGNRFVFEGGKRSTPFDLLIDASGSGSRLSPIEARALPFGALWSVVDWVPGVIEPDRLTQRYSHADRMMGVLPIGTPAGAREPKAALFWSLPADGLPAWREAGLDAWKFEAQAHWPEAWEFASQIDHADRFTMARYGHGTLWRPVQEGMVHIGDAAHRTSPQLGQGANMALLDASALAWALERHGNLDDALRAYTLSRRWHVWGYQLLSAMFTPQYQSDSRALAFVRDRLLFPLSTVPPVPAALSRLVRGTLLPPIAGRPRGNPTRT
jgi:2-polyprenyl-6-methoxyphenol hydroxylase-like FAD-dependent oxidoreductase